MKNENYDMGKSDEKYIFEPTVIDYVNPKAEVVIVGVKMIPAQIDNGLSRNVISLIV